LNYNFPHKKIPYNSKKNNYYLSGKIVLCTSLFFLFISMALRPSGFVEYSPSQQLKFDQLMEIIKMNYEKF
jgi:hypothetical protein